MPAASFAAITTMRREFVMRLERSIVLLVLEGDDQSLGISDLLRYLSGTRRGYRAQDMS